MGNVLTPYYSIYEMIGSFAKFKLPQRYGGDVVNGVVVSVFRDVIKHSIEVTVKNEDKYVFPEPDSIIYNDGRIVFVYGSSEEVSDDDFFEECQRLSNHGYGVDEVFKSFDCEQYAIVFEFSDPLKIRQSKRQKIMKRSKQE